MNIEVTKNMIKDIIPNKEGFQVLRDTWSIYPNQNILVIIKDYKLSYTAIKEERFFYEIIQNINHEHFVLKYTGSTECWNSKKGGEYV